MICTAQAQGKKHDFALFKDSKVYLHPDTQMLADSGYQGLQHLHRQTSLPKKKSKKFPLNKNDKQQNRALSAQRVLVENVIGALKRFKIIADKYRNRRRRFGLRFNLIAGIYNFQLRQKSAALQASV